MPRTIEYIGETLEIDDYEPRHRPNNQRLVRGVPVDPCLRQTFEMTPNQDRDQQELDDWWGRPFVVSYRDSSPGFKEHWPTGQRYDVRCLDGGAWDRSTWRGSYGSLDEAIDAACALAAKGPGL